MRNLTAWSVFVASIVAMIGCQDEDEMVDGAGVTFRKAVPQRALRVAPPVGLQTPPTDAEKTESGLLYKRLRAGSGDAVAAEKDTVMVRYTGWRQRTGETFFTTRGSDQPIAIERAHAAPAFRELLSVLHKGEKAIFWLPASADIPEPIAYEVEVVDIVPKPTVATEQGKPAPRGSPPAAARAATQRSPETAAR